MTPHSDILLLIDAMARLRGRLRSAFEPARAWTGLSEMDQTVLTAVAEAKAAPTVSQIARSLGHPRQVIQRAANALYEADLITLAENPDHKRAQLLVATDSGRAMQAEANRRGEAIAAALMESIDVKQVRNARKLLDTIRTAIEQYEKDRG